jgi:hypothetical protein
MALTLRVVVVLLACGLLALCYSFIFRSSQSDILISDRMSEFVDTVDRSKSPIQNKLIVFDLDDTVFMSSLLVGTPTWFYTMINLMRQNGAAKYEAYAVARKIDEAVQERVKVVAVEQATLRAIRNWQEAGAVVVAITSRTVEFAAITDAQLKQIGLAFSSKYFSCVEERWNKTDGAFINGVLYLTAWQTRSEVFNQLSDLIEECGFETELIAAADDQQRYVTEISRIATKRGIDFIGIIYGGALSYRKFDLSIAKKQVLGLEASLDAPIIPDEYRSVFAVE